MISRSLRDLAAALTVLFALAAQADDPNIETYIRGVLPATAGDFESCHFAADGTRIVAYNEHGSSVFGATAPYAQVAHLKGRIQTVALSPDSREMLVGTGNSVGIWSAADLALRRSFLLAELKRNHIASFAYLPDGRGLAIGLADKVVVVETENFTPIAGLEYAATRPGLRPTSLAFAPDPDRLFMLWTHHNVLQELSVVELASGAHSSAPLDSIAHGESPAFALAPDRATFAVKVVHDAGCKLMAADAKTLRPRWTVDLKNKGTANLLFSVDSHWLVLGGINSEVPGEAAALRIVDVGTGAIVKQIPATAGGGMRAFAFSPDGKTLASCPPVGKGPIVLWDWTKITAELPQASTAQK